MRIGEIDQIRAQLETERWNNANGYATIRAAENIHLVRAIEALSDILVLRAEELRDGRAPGQRT